MPGSRGRTHRRRCNACSTSCCATPPPPATASSATGGSPSGATNCAMGYGDELIASGLARGAAGRGKRIAFGDGRRIIWSDQSHAIFRGNPNVARPGSERESDLEWIAHYRGNRLYGLVERGRWRFRDFVCPPGEIVFDPGELAFA